MSELLTVMSVNFFKLWLSGGKLQKIKLQTVSRVKKSSRPRRKTETPLKNDELEKNSVTLVQALLSTIPVAK